MPVRNGVGARIAEVRKLRGMTQHELARAAFVSYSLLTKVESGNKPATPALIASVTRALRVSVAELTGQPYRGQTAGEDAIHAPVAELRREVTVYDLAPDVYERPVPGIAELARRVAEVSRLRQAASYVGLGVVLPGVLCDLRAATAEYEGVDRERVYALLAESYDAARALSYKLGYLDLASLLVSRHAYAAGRSADPLELAVGDTMRAHEMISVGEVRAAEKLMNATAVRVEGEVTEDNPAAVSVYGYLHLEAGLAAARGGDGDSAGEHLAEARAAADRLGADRDDYRLAFGPSNVDIWSVALPVEQGDDAMIAVALERAETIHLPAGTPRERSSHYYIDLGRAYVQQNRPGEALDALLTARKLSSLHTRYHPMVRETARAIARLEHRPGESLRSFASWLSLRI
ncbi:MAG TPA: helix-turn-helix transcriptional regulator [Streptosporangiaceae bacterium]|jgi:transcriptional regulator with XRE-family HTH domain